MPATLSTRTEVPHPAFVSYAGRLGGSLPGLAVDRLPDQVGMTVVAGVLLDHVQQDPAQAELPEPIGLVGDRETVQARAFGTQGRIEYGVRAAYGLVEEREQLLGRVVLRRVPLPVAVGLPVDGVEGGHQATAREVVLEPALVDDGEVLHHPAQRHVAGRQRLGELGLGETRALPTEGVAVMVEEPPEGG